MPRITPITTKSALAAEHQSVADSVVNVFGHIRGPFSMLLYSPMLAERLLPIVTFVRKDTIIEPGLRFVAILAAARESEAEYVWAAQVTQARSHGIREDLIDLLRSRGDADKLPIEEREVLNYVRQLVRAKRVEQPTFAALKKRHGEKWLVELTAVAGFFAFVSGIVNAFEVDPPPGGDKLPA